MNSPKQRIALVSLFLLVVGFPMRCVAQDISNEESLEKLLLVEEHFQKIRKKCCVLVRGELTKDDPNLSRPVTILLDTIYASDTAMRAKRHDIGFGDDILSGTAPENWTWNRTLKTNGNEEVRLQGNATGGISDSKETLFFSLFDPLCFTVAGFGDLVSRRLDESWFTRLFAMGEFVNGHVDRNGDIVLTVFTAKDRSVAATLLLSKKVEFLPVHCEVGKNFADDKAKEFKRGKLFSETDTTWERIGDTLVPKTVRIRQPKNAAGKSGVSEFELTWFLNDFDTSLLFEEALMRSRWDSLNSLWADLNATKSKKRK